MIELENSHVAYVVFGHKLVQVECEVASLQGVVLWVDREVLAQRVVEVLHDSGFGCVNGKWKLCAVVPDHQNDFAPSTKAQSHSDSRLLPDVV